MHTLRFAGALGLAMFLALVAQAQQRRLVAAGRIWKISYTGQR